MLIRPVILLIVSLLTPLIAHGQQSPNPQTIPVQPQAAPCTTAPTSNLKAQGDSISLSPKSKWKQALDKRRQDFEIATGIHLPDPMQKASEGLSSKVTPCPPRTTAAIATPVVQALKLPSDSTVTLHCNPMTPSSKDATHPTTLTLPDPHDFAVPKPSDFEADSVVPDLAAKTPCYLVKIDPKTQKSFIQQ